MKMCELNKEELKQINGGNDSASSGGLSIGLGLDNLLSFSSETHDGDESSKTSFSLGNGLGLSLGGIFKNISD